MKTFVGSPLGRRTCAWLLAAALAASVAACKKRKLPTADDDEPTTSSSAAARTAEEKAKASAPRGAPPATATAPQDLRPAAQQPPVQPRGGRPGMIDREPDRAREAVFDTAIPAGVKALAKSSGSALFESVYTLRALKSFYARELGGGHAIEERTGGFQVKLPGHGFVLVTEDPIDQKTRISVIPPRRTKPTDRPPEILH